MPVEDLIRYFNLADRSGDGMLYPNGEWVEAWSDGFRLASLFRPIVIPGNGRIVGHQAMLAARRDDGAPATVDQVYAVCDSRQAVVHLDRLCRTLHALNFLAQRRHAGGYLQLAVHPRHLQAVPNQHGLVYEAILKRCGLAPEDIVLELDPGNAAADPHFAHALGTYRQRGYRLAVRLQADGELASELLALRPDILRLTHRRPDAARTARQAGIAVEQSGIDDESAFELAQADDINLGQGKLFGEPAKDCRPTHKPARPPKIHLSCTEQTHENRQ